MAAKPASLANATKKPKYVPIPKTLREGWAEVTRSTPCSPESCRTSRFRVADELSRSVNLLLDVHDRRVGSTASNSSDSVDGDRNSAQDWGECQTGPRKASLQPTPKVALHQDMPRRSSTSRLFDSGGGRRSPHSSLGNLLTAVLSKTLRKNGREVKQNKLSQGRASWTS
ncbi:hypothetical protein OUZ56_030369 [Daphnia magna]|uniref:Uncharacterized protein n=1 Tax=Daphnia magna TaxID=35525 RepID=A0ABQ9ZR33_9CRUS|nr:hypothetical protein OUZ56_030369 [Daphnia magna]